MSEFGRNPYPKDPPKKDEDIDALAKSSAGILVDRLSPEKLGRGPRGVMRDLVKEHLQTEHLLSGSDKPFDPSVLHRHYKSLGIGIKDPTHAEDSTRDYEREGMEKAITTVDNFDLKTKFVEVYMNHYLASDPASVVVMLTNANVANLALLGEGPVLVGYDSENQPIFEDREYDRQREALLDHSFLSVKRTQDRWRIAHALDSTRHVDEKDISGRDRIVPADHESVEMHAFNQQKWRNREQATFAEYAEAVLQANLATESGDEISDTRLKFIFNRMKRRNYNGFQGGALSNLSAQVARRVIVRDVETGNPDDAVDHAIDIRMSPVYVQEIEADPANAGEIFDKWIEATKREHEIYPNA